MRWLFLKISRKGNYIIYAVYVYLYFYLLGVWARTLGQMAGVNVPLVAMHHAYVVTERIEGIQVLHFLYLCPLALVLRSVRNMSCHYVNTPATTLFSYVKI